MFVFIVCGAACGMASGQNIALLLVLVLDLDPFSWFMERQFGGA
jgi:hypothetical protein